MCFQYLVRDEAPGADAAAKRGMRRVDAKRELPFLDLLNRRQSRLIGYRESVPIRMADRRNRSQITNRLAVVHPDAAISPSHLVAGVDPKIRFALGDKLQSIFTLCPRKLHLKSVMRQGLPRDLSQRPPTRIAHQDH